MRLLLSLTLAAVSVQAQKKKCKGCTRGDMFITAQELNKMMEAKDPKLVTPLPCWRARQVLLGHIPGSFHLWRPDYEARRRREA